jgi:tetratricopeptide (TPR) repeat protein
MIRQDYIMRMIEQLLRVLAEATALKKATQYPEALLALDQALQELTGFDSKFVNALPDESLILMLKSGDTLDADKCIIIADLLEAEGDIYEAQGRLDESYYRYLKALNLFLAAFLSHVQTNLPHHFVQIETIGDKLALYELPRKTKYNLWQYYEQVGRYAQAEDVLYELIEAEADAPEIVAQGISFYQRLLSKSSKELVTGNLPRAEIEEALAELREIKPR